MRSELPIRVLQGSRHEVEFRRLAVDHGCGRNAKVFEHLRQSPQSAPVSVVAPTFVRKLRNGLQVRLNGRATATWDEDFHVDNGNDEAPGASPPAFLDLFPPHAQ